MFRFPDAREAGQEKTKGRTVRCAPTCGKSSGDDVDDLAAAARAELDRASGEREERVVLATADVVAGVEVRTALADDDLARVHDLATEALDAEALRVRVATVARGARTLLVCHVSSSAYLIPVTLRRVSSCRCPRRLR